MAQHWYASDGTPEHFRGPNGSPTTLREARKFGLVPSVSTVLDCIAKHGLENYKHKQAVRAAWDVPVADQLRACAILDTDPAEREPEDAEWLDALLWRLRKHAARHAQEAADEGSRIHAAIEASFAGQPVESFYRKHVSGVRGILKDNYPHVKEWVIEQSFAHPDGFGGKPDIRADCGTILGDHKGAAFGPDDDDKTLVYDQHWQLGGYAEGLDLPEASRAFNLFVSRTHPGLVRLHEWPAHKLAEGRRVFRSALQLWRDMKGYHP